MSDDDMIRRGDAFAACRPMNGSNALDEAAALPAVTVGVRPLVWEPENDGSGWYAECPIELGSYFIAETVEQREEIEKTRAARILAALDLTPAPDLSDPVTVHANMLRGSIAKPTVEQIIHLYGREAFHPMIDAAIAKALEGACLAVSEHADWPEDEHGRTEQVDLFARVINAIREITPAVTPAPDAPAEDTIAKGETCGQMLDRLGADGSKWAAEFRTTALRLGYSDMDEGWLIGWFCNAIMAGYDRKPAPDALDELARLGQEWDADDVEPCGKCMGSGYGGHPDSGALCTDCNGKGGIIRRPAPDAAAIREAALREAQERVKAAWVPGERMTLSEVLYLIGQKGGA